MSDVKHSRLIIIGSGPAGYTAAIYGARANLKPLVITGMEQGGQLTTTTEVENYPGFPEGIMGPSLMMDMRAQAERFGTVMQAGNVDSIDCQGPPFRVKAGDHEHEVPAVIIATGSTARRIVFRSAWLNLRDCSVLLWMR